MHATEGFTDATERLETLEKLGTCSKRGYAGADLAFGCFDLWGHMSRHLYKSGENGVTQPSGDAQQTDLHNVEHTVVCSSMIWISVGSVYFSAGECGRRALSSVSVQASIKSRRKAKESCSSDEMYARNRSVSSSRHSSADTVSSCRRDEPHIRAVPFQPRPQGGVHLLIRVPKFF